MNVRPKKPKMIETVTCWRCGVSMNVETSKRTFRTYCKDCKEIEYQEREKQTKEYLILKSKVMFENAMRGLEKQKLDMDYYHEACDVVKDLVNRKPTTFDSAAEIMACIQLINNEVEVKPQYKINNYTVDFCLPKLKIILEIDGVNHGTASKMLCDAKRDVAIMNELDNDWEIIRVRTSFIEKKVMMLLEYLKKEYKDRRIYRKEYNGILPDSYSDHTKVLYREILGISKQDESYKPEAQLKTEECKKELREFKKSLE